MKCNEIYCQGWCYEVNYVVVRLNISSTTLTFSDRENCHLPGIVFINKKVLIVFIPWTDELERLEVLKWIQKSHTAVWIFFCYFPTYQTDDLLFLWLGIYTLVFLHIAASGNICRLGFLYETNSLSLKTEGGDSLRIACTWQRKDDVKTPAGVISLFAANLFCAASLCSRLRGTRDHRLTTEADPVANFLYKSHEV